MTSGLIAVHIVRRLATDRLDLAVTHVARAVAPHVHVWSVTGSSRAAGDPTRQPAELYAINIGLVSPLNSEDLFTATVHA